MGVHGLTTYIAENSQIYLKPYKLHNSYLVVDGNSIASQLYFRETKSDSAFGGDYDEYYKIVRDFFSLLKRCNVTPIVLFDGGYEKKKVKTILSRAGAKLPILRNFARGFSRAKFFPLFMTQTFYDVMEDLGIFCMRCDLEADIEIATVARALNCPVLSYDSDFYIYNVLYIPFNSVVLEVVKFSDSNNFYLNCSLFDVTNFVNEFTGLDKSMLPILAILLGNDYVNCSIFQNFFGHVIIQKNKNKSYNQRKIHGVLHWLKKENVESATSLILSHLDSKSKEKVLKAIQTSVDDYSSNSVSESVVDQLTLQLSAIRLDRKNCGINLQPEVFKLYSHCKIHKFIIDIILLGVYITPVQVEDVYYESSHFPSLQLIRDTYRILIPYMQEQQNPFKLYLTVQNQYSPIKIDNDSSNYLDKFNLHNVLKESKEVRLKWLCTIVGINEDDLKIISNNNWSIFIMSVIYWIRKLNQFLSFAHIHAIILMAIANEAVQKYVGYFRNHSKFMKSKKSSLEKLKTTTIKTADCNSFDEMLASVTLYEKLLVQSNVISFRQTTEKGTGKAYCISTVHLFACFQSCLFHIMQVNALLNYPLPHLKISDFYSGTLLFNFFLLLKGKPQVEKFGCNLFKETPNLYKIYIFLYENLCKYSAKEPATVGKMKKKKRRNHGGRKESENSGDENEVLYSRVDDDEYDDKNNVYAVLQNYELF